LEFCYKNDALRPIPLINDSHVLALGLDERRIGYDPRIRFEDQRIAKGVFPEKQFEIDRL
jgi:hypothetical protein